MSEVTSKDGTVVHRRCRATMHGASWQHGAPSLASATVADKAGVDVVDDYQPHRGRGCRRYAYLLGEHPQVLTHPLGGSDARRHRCVVRLQGGCSNTGPRPNTTNCRIWDIVGTGSHPCSLRGGGGARRTPEKETDS